MNTPRFARMLTSMRGAALLAALLIIGFATMAQGFDGDPLIIGVGNQAGTATGDGSFTDWDVSHAEPYGIRIHSDGGGTPLKVLAWDYNLNPALVAEGNAIAIQPSGRIILGGRSGVATVPVGAKRVTISALDSVDPITPATLVLATVQQTTGGAMVKAGVPNPSQESFTIYLNKSATVTVVAWTLIN